MVWFSCPCGETVKKPAVYKHSMSCHTKARELSCLDCGEVFDSQTASGHNTCISEAEKYMGSEFKGVPNSTSGSKNGKQDRWLDIVKASLQAIVSGKSDSADHQLKEAAAALLGFDNIPRKKKAFDNFVRSSLKVRDAVLIEKIWEAISCTMTWKEYVEANVRKHPRYEKLSKTERKMMKYKLITELPPKSIVEGSNMLRGLA